MKYTMKQNKNTILLSLTVVISLVLTALLSNLHPTYAENCHMQHDENCGFVREVKGQPCRHEHTGVCGENGRDCTHKHDENCGYQKAQEGHPCEHLCENCSSLQITGPDKVNFHKDKKHENYEDAVFTFTLGNDSFLRVEKILNDDSGNKRYHTDGTFVTEALKTEKDEFTYNKKAGTITIPKVYLLKCDTGDQSFLLVFQSGVKKEVIVYIKAGEESDKPQEKTEEKAEKKEGETRRAVGFEQTTPVSVPQYYETVTGGTNTVYKFKGRNNQEYFRVYGTVDGSNEGFYTSNQHGEQIDTSAPINLDNEYNTIAPYDFEAGELSVMPNDGYIREPVISDDRGYTVYSYTNHNQLKEYRFFGKIKNAGPGYSTNQWYYCDNTGEVLLTQGYIEDIDIDSNNLWEHAFIESPTAPPSGAVPVYYGLPIPVSEEETIVRRERLWAYTDRNGDPRYRVYGNVRGGEYALYECDEYGNIGATITPVDRTKEENELRPTDKIPGQELVPGEAIVSALTMDAAKDIVDGTAPFDGDNNRGNDQANNNKVVRTVDTIRYTLSYTTAIKDSSPFSSFTEGDLNLRVELNVASIKQATFDTAQMPWLSPGFQIKEEGGKVVLIGKRKLTKGSGTIALPNSGTLTVVVKVLGMKNNDTIAPAFKLWAEGAEAQGEYQTLTAASVRVSATPRYNVRLGHNAPMDYLGEIDFRLKDTDPTDKVYANVRGFSINYEIRNDDSNPAKGVKGLEIPQSEVKLNLYCSVKQNGADVTTTYRPRLWDIRTNTYGKDIGINPGAIGRDMNWLSYYAARMDVVSAPATEGQNGNNQTNSATFNAVDNGLKLNDATQTYRTQISVTASEFDFGSYLFPFQAWHGGGLRTIPENAGTFTVGYVQIAFPVPQTYQPLVAEVQVENFETRSLSNELINTQVKNDDDTQTVPLRMAAIDESGSYGTNNWNTQPPNLDDVWWRATLNALSDFWMVPGEEVGLGGSFNTNGATNVNKNPYAANVLIKFDDRAWELPGGLTSTSLRQWRGSGYSDFEVKVYYAAKSNGQGWSSEAEMASTKEQQLIYFTTSDALLQNYTCVGLLFELRPKEVNPTRAPQEGAGSHNFTVKLKVRNNVPTLQVYQQLQSTRIYDLTRYNAGKTQNGGTFPSRVSASSTGTAFLNEDTNCYFRHNVHPYSKSQYGPEGITVEHSGYWWGNCAWVPQSLASVTKNVEQQNADGTQRSVFNIATGQTRVDYSLTPKCESTIKDGTPPTAATVTITETLPAGLTYRTGSSKYGGTYNPATETHSGGTAKEPAVSPDGRTLTWTFTGITPGAAMQKIYYSCDIAQSTQGGTKFGTSVQIKSGTDRRSIAAKNSNISTNEIAVTNLQESKLLKSTGKARYEYQEEIAYTVSFTNASNNTLNNINIVDILPHQTDGRGTKYDGSYKVKSIELMKAGHGGTPPGKIHYDTASMDMVDLDAKYADSYSGWQGQSDNFIDNGDRWKASAPENTTIFRYYGNVAPNATITIVITLQPENNVAGNVYANDATVYAAGMADLVRAPAVQARIVNRTISGRAWLDVNKNGKQDNGEPPLSGVKVTLQTKDGNPARNVSGSVVDSQTVKANGEYTFKDLPAGEYRVLVEGSPTFAIGRFNLTNYRESGVGGGKNSDAEVLENPGGVLLKAVVKGIVLPRSEDMSMFNFVAGNMDIGFTADNAMVKTAQPQGGDSTADAVRVTEGQVITYTIHLEYPAIGTKNPSVSDIIPEGMNFIGNSIHYQYPGQPAQQVSNASYDNRNRTINWPQLNLPEGVTKLTFKAVVDKTANKKTYSNTATVKDTSYSELKFPASNTVHHYAMQPVYKVDKTAALKTESGFENENGGTKQTPVDTNLEQVIEYRLTVTNQSPADIPGNRIEITDFIPKDCTYVENSMSHNFPDSETQLVSEDTYTENGKNGVKWVVDNLHGGKTATFTFQVKAPDSSDNKDTFPEFETEKTVENTAHVADLVQKEKAYAEEIRDANGYVIHSAGDKVYSQSDYKKASQTTYHKVTQQLCKYTIKKKLTKPSAKAQMFLFEVTYTDQYGQNTAVTYQQVEVPKGDTEAQITVENVGYGTYKVREIENNWKFKLQSPNDVIIGIDDSTQDYVFTFINKEDDSGYLGDSEEKRNKLPPLAPTP